MGRPRVVARLHYEAHCTGGLKDAVLTGTPYLIAAFLFAAHLWRHPVIAPLFFLAIVATTLIGWWWGKPNWLYSWIGFSLFPLLVGGFSLREPFYAGLRTVFAAPFDGVVFIKGFLVLIFYIAAFWLILSTTIRVARRDWLLASFMLIPLPVLGLWVFELERIGGFFQPPSPAIFMWDGKMAAVSLVLAITLSAYVRLHQRRARKFGLMFIGANALAFVVHSIWTQLTLLPVVLISLCLLLLLLSPAFVEKPSSEHGRELTHWIEELEQT
jgi:hypothetical protein